jgi:hypothetical protein
LSASNVLASGSNVHVAYKFLAARTQSELKSPKHQRETMKDFKVDWAKLQTASAEIHFASLQASSAARANVALKVSEGKD